MLVAQAVIERGVLQGGLFDVLSQTVRTWIYWMEENRWPMLLAVGVIVVLWFFFLRRK